MLCDTVQELLDLVRSEAPGAEEVLCAGSPSFGLTGFCLWYPGGSVTHSVQTANVKAWDPACKELKALFLSAKGRADLAFAMQERHPFHEGCDHCLISNVMES